jgi:hypothetical protein
MRSARCKCQPNQKIDVVNGDSLTGPHDLTLVLRINIDKVIVEVLYIFVSTVVIVLGALTY